MEAQHTHVVYTPDGAPRWFTNAEAALRHACELVYLDRARHFGCYLERLQRGIAVAWSYGFQTVEVRSTAILDAAQRQRADKLTRALTGFSSFFDMLQAAGNYRPSIHCSTRNRDEAHRRELQELADLYDQAQAARGDARRAYRY